MPDDITAPNMTPADATKRMVRGDARTYRRLQKVDCIIAYADIEVKQRQAEQKHYNEKINCTHISCFCFTAAKVGNSYYNRVKAL